MSKIYRAIGRRSGYFRHINQLVAKATAQNMVRNEQRLVDILTNFLSNGQHRPPWLYGVQLGTLEQDHQAIDVVVTSDAGPLFLQVKSSEIFKHQFEAEQDRRRKAGKRLTILATIVVNERMTDGEVLGDCLHQLHLLRKQVRIHGSFLPAKRKKSG